MNPDELESRMRALEYFHDLRVLPGAWPVLRLDGRAHRGELPMAEGYDRFIATFLT